MAKTRRAPPPPPRQRRTADEARAAILDAAERCLVEAGPGAIRLQQVAADVGVSHPTVLHHFGSREALVEAVVERALGAIQADVLAAIQRAPDGEDEVAALLDRVFAALSTGGHGRALAWCALSGMTPSPQDLRLREIAEAAHHIRKSRRGAARTPPFEDTTFTILLAMFAIFAESVAWPMMSRGAGLPEGKAAEERFRRWLAGVLITHLREGGAPA
jgi:AcrR family transcriptional regulator